MSPLQFNLDSRSSPCVRVWRGELAFEAKLSYEKVLNPDCGNQLKGSSGRESRLVDRSATTGPEHAWHSTPDFGEQQHAGGQVEIEARPMNRKLALILVDQHDAKVGTASGCRSNPRGNRGVGLVL